VCLILEVEKVSSLVHVQSPNAELRRFSVDLGKRRDHPHHRSGESQGCDVICFTFEMIWKDFLVVGPLLGCEDAAAGFIRTSRCRTTPLFQPPALGAKPIDKQPIDRPIFSQQMPVDAEN
jgi:hypothetical protein